MNEMQPGFNFPQAKSRTNEGESDAVQINQLYSEEPAFRALCEEYAMRQTGYRHWASSASAEAATRQQENTQSLYELEHEIRRHFDAVNARNSVPADGDSPATAVWYLTALREKHGLEGCEVYLAPLFPLIEMAWLGTLPGLKARQFIASCGQYLRKRLSSLTGGFGVVSAEQLETFLARYLDGEAPPTRIAALAALGAGYLRTHSDEQLVLTRERVLWRCSFRVACCNTRRSPNALQWKRLLADLPLRRSFHELQTLSITPQLTLLDEMEHRADD
ncbi:hypothetical protein [Niveibacterium sp.]|uniref:hypothetical protein n=1 Tax=Niveibacterium sp. TaxID=2017444 RepID=UPI0035B283E0